MGEGAPHPERRFRRRTVRIQTDFETGDTRDTALATTLGGGGLFIETPAPLPTQAPIVVCFRLAPGGALHRVAGRVVWSYAPGPGGGIGRVAGMGIEFTDAAAAARVMKALDALP